MCSSFIDSQVMASCTKTIETLVFLDLNTTRFFTSKDDSTKTTLSQSQQLDFQISGGRSDFDPRITEFAMWAVSFDSYCTKIHECEDNLPRDCDDWCKQINPQLTEEQWIKYMALGHCKSDLTKAMLTKKNQLSDEWPSIIQFLRSLPPPICLIAHNGVAIDFRLLKSEMNRLSLGPLPGDILFLDSLTTFREIESHYIQNITKDIQQLAQMNINPLPSTSLSAGANLNSMRCNPRETEVTPVKRRLFSQHLWDYRNPTPPFSHIDRTKWTPAKKKRATTVRQYEQTVNGRWITVGLNRQLNYSLGEMYKDLFGKEIEDESQARENCKALMKVCLQFGMDFVKYMCSKAELLP